MNDGVNNDWTLAHFLYLHRDFSIATSQKMATGCLLLETVRGSGFE